MMTCGRVPSRSPSSPGIGTGEEIVPRFRKVKPIWIAFHDDLYLEHFYHCHVYTAETWDACILKTFSAEEFGLESYVTTVGANELSYTGNFANRDDSARLGEIVVPTLFTCGRADLATPATSASYQRKLPGSRLVVFEHSSHWYFEEERALYLMTLRNFLREND
jgi:pimeloyl-ACP methyl ester carboxylesterase